MMFFHRTTVVFSYLPFVKLWARQSHKHTLLCARTIFLPKIWYFISFIEDLLLKKVHFVLLRGMLKKILLKMHYDISVRR